MERGLKDTLRAGATAVGVATGLLALASTAQTPDGYIHASFGGPLDVFSPRTAASSEVLAIGDGTNDATELAALLKGPVGPAARVGAPNSPYQVAYEAGAAGAAGVTPTPVTGLTTIPSLEDPAIATAAPARKDAAILPSKPVVDSQGKIDCSGAVSCRTDPATNITTVTYPDGVVAIVQKINDLTVVAYKTLTNMLPAEISSLLPTIPTATPPVLAASAPTVAPTVAPTPVSTPTAKVPAVEALPAVTPSTGATSASIDPGPPAPNVDLSPIDNGPKVSVTTPPKDFSPGTGSGTDGIATTPKIPGLGKVKDTIGGVIDSVKGAVGSVLGPGASSKPDSSGGSDTGSQTSKSDSSTSDNSKSDNTKSDKSGRSGS